MLRRRGRGLLRPMPRAYWVIYWQQAPSVALAQHIDGPAGQVYISPAYLCGLTDPQAHIKHEQYR